MGLQINTTLENGVAATECYTKILQVQYEQMVGNYNSPIGTGITVGFYFNKAARDELERGTVERRLYILEDTTIETREAQYTYLKTLNDFIGATDV